MSEPCSFTALVHMTPPAFAAMMRSKVLDPLADAIATSVTDGLNDVVVFKYLKQEQALVVHCYFHYDRPLEDLLAQPEIMAILKAVQAKDLEGVDRAVVSHDANNFLASPPSAGFAICPGACARDDGLDAATLARFDAVQDAHFFRVADQFGRRDRPWFTSSRIVDPALRRKVERKLQARRQAIAKSQLPDASLLQPVRLFADYHYNGHVLLWRDQGSLVPLPGIDPYTLKQTAYGAADATHAVVRGQVIRTNPVRFKAVGGEAVTFYVCPEGVFDTLARPIPGAEPATFTVQGPFGRDAHRWYWRDGKAVEDAGPGGHVDDSLYFLPFILLLGSGAVYLGECRLPVDAASCEVIRKRALRRDPRVGALLWLRDETGDVVVSRWGRFGEDMTLEVQRCADPEAAWAQAEARWQDLLDEADPIACLRAEVKAAQAEGRDAEAFAAFFADWAARHGETVWREDPYNSFFWEGVEQYAHTLLRLARPEPLLAHFDEVKAEAWRWPSILEPVALACLAMGRADDALAAVRRGAWSSFHLASRLLARPEFAALLARDDAADLRSLAEYLRESPGSKPALPASLAVHWLDGIAKGHQLNALQHLFAQFEVPGMAQLEPMRAANPDAAAACEAAYARFLNATMLDPVMRRFPAYDARSHYSVWGDLPGLHPGVHLIAATALYAEGLFWRDQGATGPRWEFVLAQRALGQARRVAMQARWAGDPDWQTLAADPIYAPWLAQPLDEGEQIA